MAADCVAALRAPPSGFLVLQEPVDAMLLDVLEVSHHAHVVLGPIALVERLQPPARKALTLVTEAYESFGDNLTVVRHVQAVLAARQATWAVSIAKPLLFEVILHCLVVGA